MPDKEVRVRFSARDTGVHQTLTRMRREMVDVQRIGFRVTAAFTAGATGLLAFARSAVRVGSETEQARIRLDSIFGSVEAGADAFQAVQRAAGQLPYTFRETLDAASLMAVAVQQTGDDLDVRLRQVAEIAARTGLGIRETAENFQRFWLSGAASADLFRQRGVSAMLGIQAGAQVSVAESRRLWDEFFEGVEREGSSATDRLARSWVGTLSMIEDTWFRIRDRIASAGLFDAAKAGINAIRVAMLNLESDGTIDRWAQGLSGVFEGMLRGVAGVFDAIGNGLNAIGRNPLLAEFGLVGYAFMGAKGAALFAYIGDRINALAELLAGPQTELELRAERLQDMADVMRRAYEQIDAGRGDRLLTFGGDVFGAAVHGRTIEDAFSVMQEIYARELATLNDNFGVIWEDFEASQTTAIGSVFNRIAESMRAGIEQAFSGAGAGGGAGRVPTLDRRAGHEPVPLLDLQNESELVVPPAEAIQADKIASPEDIYTNWFRDVGEVIDEQGRDLADQMYGIGQNLVNSLISGTRDRLGALVQAALAIGSHFFPPLKIALGIFSPSKPMREMGHNLMAGLTLGIDDMLGQVTNSTRMVAQSVMSGIQVPQLGGIGDVVNRRPGPLELRVVSDGGAFDAFFENYLVKKLARVRVQGESV